MIESALKKLDWRITVEHAAANKPDLLTPGHDVLVQLLRDKERLSIERLFRTLGLRYRNENLARIYYGLRSKNPALRSSSRELLESVLPARLGAAVIALTDDLPDEGKLEAAAAWYTPQRLSLEQLLATLRAEPSSTLSAVATYYAAETGAWLDLHTEPAAEGAFLLGPLLGEAAP